MVSIRANLRHLALLCEVVRCGSVSAAARTIHVSQPAATQAIATIERQFGIRLFERTSRGMRPTDAARRCAIRIARALGRLDEAVLAIPRAGGGAAVPARGITSAQLHCLIAIDDAGGFGAAARALGVTRATVHRAARQIEHALRITLFESTSHGLRPTREGSRLARQARLAFAEIAQAHAEVAEAYGMEHRGTVIGAMPLARSTIVPAAVLRFARAQPRHAISILDGPYENLLEALRSGVADVLVGALRDETPADVRQEHLFDDPLAIVVRVGHPLAAAGERRTQPPSPRELCRFPWIAPRPGSPLRRRFDALMTLAPGAPPAAPIECNSLVAARALLLASDRMMLLSAQQVSQEMAAGQLTLLPHPGGRVARAIGLTVRRDWFPTAAQRQLVDLLRSGAREVALECPGIRIGTAGSPRRARRRISIRSPGDGRQHDAGGLASE